MRNGGAAPDPSTQFSLFRLYMIEHSTFHSAQDDEMRRTNPFEPIEPAEPLSRAIKEQHASWAKPCPPIFPALFLRNSISVIIEL